MQLTVGSYAFAMNAVFADRHIKVEMSPQRVPFLENHTWQITGELLGTGQADLIAKQAALTKALARQYQDVKLLADDGTVAGAMINSQSVDGVLYTDLHFPKQEGGVYATFLPFEVALSASFLYNRSFLLLEYSESLSIRGGGARYGLTECVNAAPVKSLITPATACMATQKGQAKSLNQYASIPGPIWPEHVVETVPQIERATTIGKEGFTEYSLGWTWEFAAPIRLNGFPRPV